MTEPAGSRPAGGPSHPSGAQYASWIQRAIAEIVDGLVLVVPALLLYAVIESAETRFTLSLVAGIVYNGVLDGSDAGQTLGKRLLRIRVVDAGTGGPLGKSRGFGRAGVTALFQYLGLLNLLTSLLELADVLWPLWDPRRQSLHDKAAGSVVVRVD